MGAENYYEIVFANQQRFKVKAPTPQEAITSVTKKLGYHIDSITPSKRGCNVIVYLLNGLRNSKTSYCVKATQEKRETAEPKVAASRHTPLTNLIPKSEIRVTTNSIFKKDKVEHTANPPKSKQQTRKSALHQEIYLQIETEMKDKEPIPVSVTNEDVINYIENLTHGKCEIVEFKINDEEAFLNLEFNLTIPVTFEKGYASTQWEPGEPDRIDGYWEEKDIVDVVKDGLLSFGYPIKEFSVLDSSVEDEETLLEKWGDHLHALDESHGDFQYDLAKDEGRL